MPPGRGFYPEGLTRNQVETYVRTRPDQKKAIFSPYTIVRRKSDGLETIPYHLEFQEFLQPMAKDLREAADLSDDPAFAKFLRLRADALLTDDHYPSDIAWLNLLSPKFDIRQKSRRRLEQPRRPLQEEKTLTLSLAFLRKGRVLCGVAPASSPSAESLPKRRF